ncbi:siderophore-interacting protein [Antrihabitans cavernicola]|uniref:Siderophore-interacting protein n=1 Tax=Antrihabitans cavernicola TaxID=2495913 RepID=A0A5A7SET8_9NOCA|nr:siderophore-interacting protein [Spelaeibacter cavernicola]KAA0023227.1 siderophore-interacting protein [Spelaeibacter cavernicola]
MARRQTTLTVQRTARVTPNMVRVYLGDPGFDDFEPNEFTDSYVKLLFDDDVKRTYTVRSVDVEAREIAIDFVVHGDDGIAGPWAAKVTPGETISMFGPGGAYAPRTDADWHLLAGDESAIPAISAAVAALPDAATAKVFIEVIDVDGEVELPSRAKVDLQFVHRGTGDTSPLVDAVREAEWLPGQPHVFIHGEADAVMHGLRRYIRRDRGVAAEWASISGYWRRGRTEEGFRVWKSELAAAEAPA